MPTPTSTGNASVTLSVAPRKGLVRHCATGCVHVTFGCVTLDFFRRADFNALCDVVLTHEGERGIQLRHGHATLCLDAEEFQDFQLLISDAVEELRRLDVVRRLLDFEE